MYKLPESISADMGKPIAKAGTKPLAVISIDSLTEEQRALLSPVK
jgi:hypothetical protein